MEMPRRRALGKGLEELFNAEVLDFDSLEEKIVTETPKEEIVDIKIDELRSNPYQPRKVFDEEIERYGSNIDLLTNDLNERLRYNIKYFLRLQHRLEYRGEPKVKRGGLF